MADLKSLRNKALSDMSVDELKSFVQKAEGAGFKISESKELGKAVDLIKVQSPSGYDSGQVDSAKLKLASSTQPDTQARLGIAGSSGMGTGFSTGTIAPINLNTMYEQAMNDPALKALQDELVAKQTARDSAEADINDNPFYTEATRVGRVAKLEEKAGDEIKTLQGQVDAKKADALVKINIATQQYDIESKAYQQNLDKLNTLISSGAIVGASSKDISQIALATGMSTDMVKSIIDSTKASQRQTQVITATDDNGNVTVSVIDTQTGERIAQNSLGSIGNRQTGSSKEKELSKNDVIQTVTMALSAKAGKDKKVSGEEYAKQRNFIVGQGFMTPTEFDDQFATSFVNPKYWETDSYNLVSPAVIESFGDR